MRFPTVPVGIWPRLPDSAEEAARWLAAGWEPTREQIGAMPPELRARLGLVYETAWPFPWWLMLALALGVGYLVYQKRRP